MLKMITASLMATLTLAFSMNASAAPTMIDSLVLSSQNAIMDQAHTTGLDWKVSDEANYDIDMGFIKGTMQMIVKSIGAEGIWMDQNIDLGFAGKQQAQTLIDPNTGEIKKMLVNGKEQEIPKQDIEVVEVTEDKITVPAGTFDCVHARIHDKTANNEINVWLNPAMIPLSGMLKQVQPGQFGTVTVALKSFKKN